MDNVLSIDEMWQVIEKYGIKRESLDPYNNATFDTLYNLYMAIKNRIHQPKEMVSNVTGWQQNEL